MIIVVANHHRKALITKYLDRLGHKVHYCKDYNLPPGWVDKHNLLPNPTGAYRAFRGHQDALTKIKTNTLVFEDDAVPIVDDWLSIAFSALSYLDSFDWISLHGREYDSTKLTVVATLENGYRLLMDPSPTKGINGCCMAYWIKPETAQKYKQAVFDGYPCDWYLWTKFKCALLEPSPFNHDRSQGSLID